MLFVTLSVLEAAIVPFLVWAYNRRRNSFSILGQLRGPKSPSFWIGEYSLFFRVQYCLMPHLDDTSSGNEGDIFHQNEVGDSEFEWEVGKKLYESC